MKRAVVALGGNALSLAGGSGSVDEMRHRIKRAVEALWPLTEEGYRLVITHGNGPQVGAQLLKNDAGQTEYDVPAYPLDVLVADTQGEIGYLIESEWRNRAAALNRQEEIATLVTMIEVDENDSAFRRPVKRVGKTYYDAAEVEHLSRTKAWQFLEETKRGRKGWRRVVPSPEPLDVVNKAALQRLSEAGFHLVAGGGGGIPVTRRNGRLHPVEAVIDKDLATALIARVLDAELFIILTDVSHVYLHYGTPRQKPLERISVEDLEKYAGEGHFGNGNMLPKILAAIRFVRRTGRRALITDFEGLHKGEGTFIVPPRHDTGGK